MPPRLALTLATSARSSIRPAAVAWRCVSSSTSSSNSAPNPGPATSASSEASSSRLPPPSAAAPNPTAGVAQTSTSSAKGKGAEVLVPPLSRPLGVPRPPSSVAKTWAQKKDELLDEDRHKAKRRHLIKEATSGYFQDYSKAVSASGGKLWTAPPVLIREDRALYFPDISGKSLLGAPAHTTDLLKGKITLLSILSTRISEEHVLGYTAPLLPDWLPTSKHLFQHVQINHQANPLKSMLLSFFISSLKRTVPEDGWGRYMVSGGEWSHYDIDGPLGLDNKLVGYVFLIDQNIKVRWAACGPATESEVDSLRKGAAVLMRRAADVSA